MPDYTQIVISALTLDKIGSLFLLAVGASLVYLFGIAVPPMIKEFLRSISASLERISVTMAEVVLTNGRIHVDVGDYSDMMTRHHENAMAIKECTVSISDKVDEANRTLDRLEVTLNNRPCIK